MGPGNGMFPNRPLSIHHIDSRLGNGNIHQIVRIRFDSLKPLHISIGKIQLQPPSQSTPFPFFSLSLILYTQTYISHLYIYGDPD